MDEMGIAQAACLLPGCISGCSHRAAIAERGSSTQKASAASMPCQKKRGRGEEERECSPVARLMDTDPLTVEEEEGEEEDRGGERTRFNA